MLSRSTSRGFAVFKSLINIMSPHRKWATLGAVLSGIAIIISLSQTFFTQQLVSQTITGNLSVKTVLVFVLLIFCSAAVSALSTFASGRLGAYCGRDLKQTMAARVMKANYNDVRKVSSGDAVSILNSDNAQIAQFISSDMLSLVTQALTAVCAFAYLVFLNPILGLVSFAYTPIGMFLASRVNRRMNHLYPQSSILKGKALSAVEQALHSLPVIKSFCMEKRITEQFEGLYASLNKTDSKIAFWNALFQPACLALANTPSLIFMIAGGSMALSGKLELGGYVAMLQLIGYIVPPTVMLPFMLNNLNRTGASLGRVNEILNIPIRTEKPPRQINIAGSPSVFVDNLSFEYDDGTNVLKSITFKIEKPGIVALAGISGSGKTTLISLLSSLYSPDEGSIYINGHRLSELSDNQAASLTAVVPQDIQIFAGTIMDNIQMGRADAADIEVIRAAEATGVDEYADRFKDGYETLIGDGGSSLSGGQEQKLALARAFLKNAPVWLLDEPTSALDGISEIKLHELIQDVAKTKIVLVAAHRLSTLSLADRVLYIKDGTIAADGSYDNLLSCDAFVNLTADIRGEGGAA